MAKFIYEKRSFTNTKNGEIIAYEAFAVQAVVNGEFMELRLKNLEPAEKMALKILAGGETPTEHQTAARAANEEEVDAFFANTKRVQSDDNSINLDDED